MLGNSPESANDVMVTSSNVLPNDELDALLGSLTNASSKRSSAEVKINVGEFPYILYLNSNLTHSLTLTHT